jgi:hypothetical protein
MWCDDQLQGYTAYCHVARASSLHMVPPYTRHVPQSNISAAEQPVRSTTSLSEQQGKIIGYHCAGRRDPRLVQGPIGQRKEAVASNSVYVLANGNQHSYSNVANISLDANKPMHITVYW